MTPDAFPVEKQRGGIPIDVQSLIENPNQNLCVNGLLDNEEIFVDSFQDTDLRGGEVYALEVHTLNHEFRMEGNWHAFRAGLENVIEFNIKTRDPLINAPSKNFFAGDLVDSFMHILKGLDHPVENLKFRWNPAYRDEETGETLPASTNLLQYEAALKTLPPEKAAFETWTGKRIAQKYGLTKLAGKIENIGGAYTGVFTRPEPQISATR